MANDFLKVLSEVNMCRNCKYYKWYKDYCEKRNCEVDGRWAGCPLFEHHKMERTVNVMEDNN